MIQGTATVGYMDPGKWSACFGMSLRDLYLYDARHEGRIVRPGAVELRVQAGAGGLADGRNHIVSQFLEHDSEWLFFIDSDMGFAPDTVDRLVESADQEDRPVVGALCFQLYQKGQAASFYGNRYGIMPTLYENMGGEGYRHIPDFKRDAVVPVDATGGACMVIHRTVLEKIQRQMGSVWFMQLPGFSEDLSFMKRLARLDIPVHVNTAVKTTHDKQSLFLDEELYDQSRPWARDPLEE